MKTRAEIYGNEAAALLRIVTMYPGLNMQQLLCFHPGKEEIIKTLLSHLQKQGRIFQTDTGGYFPSGWAAKSDNSLIRAAWVLLDFIGQVEYHAPGDFPVKLIFFANGELYEIVYAASGQEALINHALRDDRSGGRRIILVDNPEDIRRIDCPGISGFCTVDAAGQVHYFKKFLRSRGYCVKVFNLVSPENSDSWCCLAEVEGQELMAQLFVDVIIKNTTNNGKSDHFWDACEMNLLKALVLYVDQGYAEENRNIGEVYRLLTLNGESQLDTLFEALPSTHPAKAPYSLFKQASDTVRSGVIIGLGSRLQVFQSELIKKITAKNEIDLELPGQQPCAYFLVTSDQDSTFDFLASLFLSFCFIKLVRYADHNCEGGKLPVPVHILGEELTACGTIPDLSRRLSVIRSRNISMSCVFQNLAGLQNRYPQNLWQEIIGNCDAQLFLGCTDQLTAEFISARTGLASVAVSSKSKQLGTWRISNYTPEFRETSGVGKRPVLTPDEVLRLPLDQALIIIRGKKVLQVDKMDYSKHPEAKYLRSCKASAHVPEWRRLEEEAAKTPQPAPKPAPAAKKPAKRKATKPASPTDKSPKETPTPKSAGTPEGIITTDKDSILS